MIHNKTIIQSVVSMVFAFLLTITLVVLFVCFGLGSGVFNDRIVLSKVNESNYYNKIYEQLMESAEDILLDSGLPTSILADVITLERVYIGGKYYIEDTLEGKEPVAKTDKIRETLTQNINQYLEENKIIRTDELNQGVNEIIAGIEQEYKREVEFQFIKYLTRYKDQYQDVIKIVIPILVVLIGILCFFLVRLQKYKHRGIRYITYATLASSSMTILTSAIFLLTRSYEKVNVSPDYYRNFLIIYLEWDIKVFLYLGGIGIIVSILLINLAGYLKNQIHND